MKTLFLTVILCVCVFPILTEESLKHLNVLGSDLQVCSLNPLTGWTRSGKCENWSNDQGTHLICAKLTDDFLQYTKSEGNDLSTPRGSFPGLKQGDNWCLCVFRWNQARKVGHAPKVVLESTNEAALQYLNKFGVKLSDFKL